MSRNTTPSASATRWHDSHRRAVRFAAAVAVYWQVRAVAAPPLSQRATEAVEIKEEVCPNQFTLAHLIHERETQSAVLVAGGSGGAGPARGRCKRGEIGDTRNGDAVWTATPPASACAPLSPTPLQILHTHTTVRRTATLLSRTGAGDAVRLGQVDSSQNNLPPRSRALTPGLQAFGAGETP